MVNKLEVKVNQLLLNLLGYNFIEENSSDGYIS